MTYLRDVSAEIKLKRNGSEQDNEKSWEVKKRSKGRLLHELFPNAPLGATCKAWQKMWAVYQIVDLNEFKTK